MENVVTGLTTTLSAANVWGVFSDVVPLIGVVTLVALGFFLVRKGTKAIAKLKPYK